MDKKQKHQADGCCLLLLFCQDENLYDKSVKQQRGKEQKHEGADNGDRQDIKEEKW